MIAILRHQQMREHRRRGTTTRGRHRRCRSLGDRIARLAGILWPDMPNDLEAARHVVEYLGHVLTELCHAGTTVGARACAIGFRLVDDLLPRQVIRQLLALRLRALTRRAIFRLGLGDVLRLAGLQLFKLKLQLFDLTADPFR